MSMRYAKPKGMTLLEVMVALTIFSMTALTIMKVLSSQLTALPMLEDRMVAQWVADNQMVLTYLEQKQRKQAVLPLGTTKGEVSMMTKTWYWERTVLKMENADFRQVKIAVSDDAKVESPIIELESYVAKM